MSFLAIFSVKVCECIETEDYGYLYYLYLIFFHSFAVLLIIKWLNYFLDKILLKIKRTASNKTRCAYPSCVVKQRLKRISSGIRRMIAIQLNKFVPQHSVVCDNHVTMDNWQNVNSAICFPSSEFTKEHIEDMFNLLTNESIKTDALLEPSNNLLI